MSRKDKHHVRLTADERRRLTRLVRSGEHPTRAVTHARILLKADAASGPAWGDAAIAAALDCGVRTVARVRKKFAEAGLDPVIHRKRPAGRRYRKLDGEQEARLVALACSARRRGRPGGRCGCWPTGWSSCGSWTRSPTRRSGGRSKKLGPQT